MSVGEKPVQEGKRDMPCLFHKQHKIEVHAYMLLLWDCDWRDESRDWEEGFPSSLPFPLKYTVFSKFDPCHLFFLT